jgi:hypothetical protein
MCNTPSTIQRRQCARTSLTRGDFATAIKRDKERLLIERNCAAASRYSMLPTAINKESELQLAQKFSEGMPYVVEFLCMLRHRPHFLSIPMAVGYPY